MITKQKAEKEARVLLMMEIMRTFTPVGSDVVLRRVPTVANDISDARAQCRRRLEAEIEAEGNPNWPTVGGVRIVDVDGREIATYGYLQLVDDRNREHLEARALERSNAKRT
jgi:hypothetical protein